MVATEFIAKPPGDGELIVYPREVVLTLDVGSAEREAITVNVSPHSVVVEIKGAPDGSRTFALPVEVQPDSQLAKAEAVNGVLSVVVPRVLVGTVAYVRAMPVQSQLDGAGVSA